MERFRISSETLDSRILRRCIDTLGDSGLICYPTETFYALGIDSRKISARKKLFALKERTLTKELPFIASDIQMVRRFCRIENDHFSILSERFWPGPLTLVLPSREESGTIAIRVSNHPIACQIARALGRPLVSTSANRSGYRSVRTPDELHEAFLNEIDLIIDAGPCAGGSPSTILSLVGKKAELIRRGAIPFHLIQPFL